ncbi:MAG: trigger factor [Caryophanon sp.]|nr:trigger factor [Caryophanon sp.]
MSVKFEKQEANTGLLTVEVPVEAVNKALDAAFKKVVTKINEPGFRKGKMPRALFDKKYGVAYLAEDALDLIVPEFYSKAVDQADIFPVAQPEIDFDFESLQKDAAFTFTAKVTLKPEVELGEYKGLEVTKQDATVTDEEIEAQIQDQLAKKAELEVKEEGAVVEGDTAVIDFEGFVGEEAFEGGKGDDYALEIGSGSFIPGFEEQLVGAATGETKDVLVTFPEEYHAPELAGKEAKFVVTVKEIKTKVLPELNDEFAKEIDAEVDGLDALRAKLKAVAADQKEFEADAQLRADLVAKAAENAKVEIPAAMIETEIEQMKREFEQRLSQQGLNLELFFQFTGQDAAALEEQMKPEAEQRVVENLVVEAIAKAEAIEVTEEDINKEVSTLEQQFGMSADQIVTALGGTDAIKQQLVPQKTVQFLVDNAKISE